MWFHKCPEFPPFPEPEVTREHVAELHTHVDQVIAAMAELALLPNQTAEHLFAVVAALRAFESSHRRTIEMHVNGFPVPETTLCECALCKGARAALG